MSSGTCRSLSSGYEKTISSTAIAAEKASPPSMVVLICLSSCSYFFAPYWVLIRIPAPMHIPLIKRITMFMIGPALPTAARASSPTNFPTITESAALYVSWNRFPSTSGIVNSVSCGIIGPFVISVVISLHLIVLYRFSRTVVFAFSRYSSAIFIPSAISHACA